MYSISVTKIFAKSKKTRICSMPGMCSVDFWVSLYFYSFARIRVFFSFYDTRDTTCHKHATAEYFTIEMVIIANDIVFDITVLIFLYSFPKFRTESPQE